MDNAQQQPPKKKTSAGKIILIVVGVIIALGVIGNLGKDKTKTASNDASSNSTQSSANTQIGIGQVLHTKYFDITVNNVRTSDRVNTDNEFSDLNPEAGTKYLIFNATFKNTDSESRMLSEGSVWINYNGKDYEFDKSETIMADGWGLFLDQINPMLSKTTNLVYKLPLEVKGAAYWQPGRANKDQKIFLGDLK